MQISLTPEQQKLVEDNTGLVGQILKTVSFNKEDLLDVKHAGFVALCKSAVKFDASMGFQFSTYAYKGISRAMWREANESRNERNLTFSQMGDGGEEVAYVDTIKAKSYNSDVALLRKSIEKLPESQRKVMEMISEGNSLQEIGCEMGTSRQRVGQIKNQAMASLQKMMA